MESEEERVKKNVCRLLSLISRQQGWHKDAHPYISKLEGFKLTREEYIDLAWQNLSAQESMKIRIHYHVDKYLSAAVVAYKVLPTKQAIEMMTTRA